MKINYFGNRTLCWLGVARWVEWGWVNDEIKFIKSYWFQLQVVKNITKNFKHCEHTHTENSWEEKNGTLLFKETANIYVCATGFAEEGKNLTFHQTYRHQEHGRVEKTKNQE